MNVMQAAYLTYRLNANKAGVFEPHESEGRAKEALLPIAHIVQNAQIEVTIDSEGNFVNATAIEKGDNKTIIPATIASATRTGNPDPHPLCDSVWYLTSFFEESRYYDYLRQLESWANWRKDGNAKSHTFVKAVYEYIKKRSLVADLCECGVFQYDENAKGKKIEGVAPEKCVVRWCVIPSGGRNPVACHKDKSLFDNWTNYYLDILESEKKDVCYITGNTGAACNNHPKGVLAHQYGAKLISSNDSANFTYKGRFATPDEALSVSYIASQSAHYALRWVIANHGFSIGGDTFVCWNPEGKDVNIIPFFDTIFRKPKKKAGEVVTEPVVKVAIKESRVRTEKEIVQAHLEKQCRLQKYKDAVVEKLNTYRETLAPDDDVYIAAFQAPIPGRLSVTYFQEIKAHKLIERVEKWYLSLCSLAGDFAFTPTIKDIVTYAFGLPRKERLEAEDFVLSMYTRRLLNCLLIGSRFPEDVLTGLRNACVSPIYAKVLSPAYNERIVAAYSSASGLSTD